MRLGNGLSSRFMKRQRYSNQQNLISHTIYQSVSPSIIEYELIGAFAHSWGTVGADLSCTSPIYRPWLSSTNLPNAPVVQAVINTFWVCVCPIASRLTSNAERTYNC